MGGSFLRASTASNYEEKSESQNVNIKYILMFNFRISFLHNCSKTQKNSLSHSQWGS